MGDNDYIEQWFYDFTAVSRLPIPRDLEDPPCLVGVTPLKRGWRRLMAEWDPRPQRLRDCCWFHAGDWHRASGHAMDVVNLATGRSADLDEDITDSVAWCLEHRGLTGWMHEAVDSLLSTGEPINYGSTAEWRDPEEEPFYVGGRHRAAAMMQQGVHATVTMRLELLDPDTRQIILD